jgi:hypothetical protein
MVRLISRLLLAAAVAACLGAPRGAQAQTQSTTTTTTTTTTTMAPPMKRYDPWDRSYVLTPFDHRRLRAYGLKDQEIFAAANAAHWTYLGIDDILQMYLRGESEQRIAEKLNLSPLDLAIPRPIWLTPAWQQAVLRGDLQ